MEYEYRKQLLESADSPLSTTQKQRLQLAYKLIRMDSYMELDAIVFEIPFLDQAEEGTINGWVSSAFRFAKATYEKNLSKNFQKLVGSFFRNDPALSFSHYMFFILRNFPYLTSMLACETQIRAQEYSSVHLSVPIKRHSSSDDDYYSYLRGIDEQFRMVSDVLIELLVRDRPLRLPFAPSAPELKDIQDFFLISLLFFRSYCSEATKQYVEIFDRSTIPGVVKSENVPEDTSESNKDSADRFVLQKMFIPEFNQFFQEQLPAVILNYKEDMYKTIENLWRHFHYGNLSELFNESSKFSGFFTPRDIFGSGSQTKTTFDFN